MNLCEFVSIRKALFLPLRATQEWGEISPKMSRIEPMNRRKTSNTQHPTSNNQWFPIGPLIGGWVLDVGCSQGFMGRRTAPLRISFHLQGLLQKLRQVRQNCRVRHHQRRTRLPSGRLERVRPFVREGNDGDVGGR